MPPKIFEIITIICRYRCDTETTWPPTRPPTHCQSLGPFCGPDSGFWRRSETQDPWGMLGIHTCDTLVGKAVLPTERLWWRGKVLEGPQGWVRFSKDGGILERKWFPVEEIAVLRMGHGGPGGQAQSWGPRAASKGQTVHLTRGPPSLCFMVKMADKAKGRADLEVGPASLMSMGWAWPPSQYIEGWEVVSQAVGCPGRQLKFTLSSCLFKGPHTEPDSHCRHAPFHW